MGILTHSIPLPGRTGGVSGPKNYHTDISYILYVPFNNRPSKTSTFIGVSGPKCHTDVLYLLYAPLNNIPSKTSTFIGLSGPKKLSYRPIIYLICLFQQRPCSTIILLRKKCIHLTSEKSLSTILIIHHTSESSTFILLPKEVFQQFLLHLIFKRSVFILLPKEVFQQFLLFIIILKEVHSSYFRKKSFNDSHHSSKFRMEYIHLTSERSFTTILTPSYFRKKYIHLASERSLSTFLIVHLTSERSAFILLPKEVLQQFLSFLSILQVNFTL